MKIVLLGDIWGDVNATFSDDFTHLLHEDLILGNLETPILNNDCNNIIIKAGPEIKGSKNVFKEIVLNFGNLVFALANNHIGDYGECGLESTLKAINESGKLSCGAGINYEEASKPLLMQFEKKQIAIISACERQFGASAFNKMGVNAINAEIYGKIADLKRRGYFVIISIHGGNELSSFPSPYWQSILKSYIDSGASIVHGHHSHVPQGFEYYKKGIIFYGLGNFITETERWKAIPNALWSIVPVIDIGNDKLELKIYISQIENTETPKTLNIKLKNFNTKREYIEEANRPLINLELLEAIHQEVSINEFNKHYKNYLTPPSLGIWARIKDIFKELLHKGNVDIWYSPYRKALIYHLFSCDSHSKAIQTALGIGIGEIKDVRNDEARQIIKKLTSEF